ncbi:MAG TPA: 30S ribosomal protein S4e, partial [Euryarchaeota archaeon]|nr:30S ribosomal protein S4e [Euryarchaeota archaeon]
LTIPNKWVLSRKNTTWATAPSPGPHSVEDSVPLMVIVRDMLQLADNAREGRMIIGAGKVHVDGRPVTDRKFPVGLMDVISIPEIDERYRLLMTKRGKWTMVRISSEEAKYKLVRVNGKTTVRGGRAQLNLSDGRNILLKTDRYKTGDVLKLEVPSQKVLGHIGFEKGAMALIISGAHMGNLAKIAKINVRRDSAPNVVSFEEGFSTIKDNVFIIGDKHPEITTPQEAMV